MCGVQQPRARTGLGALGLQLECRHVLQGRAGARSCPSQIRRNQAPV
jgi:hypothetical protein